MLRTFFAWWQDFQKSSLRSDDLAAINRKVQSSEQLFPFLVHSTPNSLPRMLRIGQQRSAQFARAITSTTSQASRAYTTRPNIHSSGSKPWSPSASWVLGAGVVFTGVTLVAQSPALGLSNHVVFNDSNSSASSGMLFSLPKIFGKPEPVKQEDIVLDSDLTITSWKQQEQDMLIKAPGIMLWGSNK